MSRSTLRWLFPLVLASSSARPTPAQGNVLVVGPGGFGQIQAAVQAAQDGDTILVQVDFDSPTYGAVDVAGKSLTIAADSSTFFAKVHSVRVRNVPAGKTVVLSRLRVESNSTVPLVLLQNNAGSTRLVDCEARSLGNYALVPATTLKIESSSGSTALASCDIDGGDAIYRDIKYPPVRGGRALEMQDAIGAIYDSTITGGEGGPLYPLLGDPPARGGTGATLQRDTLPTRLLLANSSIQGGRGSELTFCYYYGNASGDGGTGLQLGAGTAVTRLAATITGGPGGACPPCGTSGASGPPLVGSGTLVSNPTSAVALNLPTVAREGETITLTVTGVPGDAVSIVAGLRTTFLETSDGVLIVQPGPVYVSPLRGPLGTIGASGIFATTFHVPTLPAGVGALNLWFQALARHSDGKRTFGSFAVVTVLDSIY
jgi:hypothetical protein